MNFNDEIAEEADHAELGDESGQETGVQLEPEITGTPRIREVITLSVILPSDQRDLHEAT